MPVHVSSTSAHRQEAKIVLYSLWYHHTYRWPSLAQVERGLDGIHHILNFQRELNMYNPTDNEISLKFYNEFISCLYMFRAQVLIIRRPKLYHTISGNITLKQVSGLKLLK